MTTPVKFHYVTFGDKKQPSLLFLHGFMGSIADWVDIVCFFSDEYYCLVLDLPGHGKTFSLNDNITNNNYRMENCAENIISLLDRLDIKKTNLVAYSMGGRLAFYLAINYPERFNRIVIESASPGLKTAKERSERILQDEKLAVQLEKESLDKFLQTWYRQSLFASIDKESDKFKELFQRRLQNNPQGLSLSLKMMGTGRQPSLWDKLDQITASLLLIVGEKDDRFIQVAKAVAERCHSVKIKVVENAGHNVHFESTKEYVKQVKLFLQN